MDFNWRIILLKCLLFFVNILIYRYICGLETYYSTKMFDVWKYWFENFATLMFSVDFNRIFLPQCFPFATQSEEHQSPPTSPPLPCAAKVSSIYPLKTRFDSTIWSIKSNWNEQLKRGQCSLLWVILLILKKESHSRHFETL